ncbi:MAG: hypothetical protein Q8M37_11905 [Nevskia sp.]|nr:hypothetical protein [Nevskia sp.]
MDEENETMSLEISKQGVADRLARFGREDVQGALDVMTADAGQPR